MTKDEVWEFIKKQFEGWSTWHFAIDAGLTWALTLIVSVVGDMTWFQTINLALALSIVITAIIGLLRQRLRLTQRSGIQAFEEDSRREEMVGRNQTIALASQRVADYAAQVPIGNIDHFGIWRSTVAADLSAVCSDLIVKAFQQASSEAHQPQIAKAYLLSLATSLSTRDLRRSP